MAAEAPPQPFPRLAQEGQPHPGWPKPRSLTTTQLVSTTSQSFSMSPRGSSKHTNHTKRSRSPSVETALNLELSLTHSLPGT